MSSYRRQASLLKRLETSEFILFLSQDRKAAVCQKKTFRFLQYCFKITQFAEKAVERRGPIQWPLMQRNTGLKLVNNFLAYLLLWNFLTLCILN